MTTALSGRGLVRANEQREYKRMLTQILLWRVFTFGRSSLTPSDERFKGFARRTEYAKVGLTWLRTGCYPECQEKHRTPRVSFVAGGEVPDEVGWTSSRAS